MAVERKGGIIITTEIFISRSLLLHSGYYSYPNTVYIDASKKIEIKCPIHGTFYQKAGLHSAGKGCKECGINRKKQTKESFILKSNYIHKDKYNYSLFV